MVNVSIDQEKCIGCGACVNMCPNGVFEFGDDMKAHVKDSSKCSKCKMCEETCPVDAISVKE